MNEQFIDKKEAAWAIILCFNKKSTITKVKLIKLAP
jgi:hypothetical protein